MIAILSAVFIVISTQVAAETLPPTTPRTAEAGSASIASAADPAALLAAAVIPDEMTLAYRVPLFEAAVAKELSGDQQFSAFEQRHPGAKVAVLTAAREEVITSYRMAISLLRNDAAAIYRTNLSAVEIARALRFFATRTGQALLLTSIKASGESASEMDVERRRAGAAMFEHPDRQTQADLMILVEGVLGAKVQTIAPQLASLSQRRLDDVDRILADRLPKRIEAVLRTYTSHRAQ